MLWQLIRIHADPGKPLMFPRYPDLMRALGASRGGVASAITLLRLTRWLLHCARVRDDRGRFRGQVLALCDHVVPVKEALRWDNEYLELVAKAREHRYAHVAKVAKSMLAGFEAEARGHPVRQHRVHYHQVWKNELGTQVQKMNSDSLYTLFSSSNCSSKGNPRFQNQHLTFSKLLDLPPTQERLIRIRLQSLPERRAQEVLDEAAGRIRLKEKTRDPVRSRFDYLAELIRRAEEGDFVFSDAGQSIRQDRSDAELASWARKRAESRIEEKRIERLKGAVSEKSDQTAQIRKVS